MQHPIAEDLDTPFKGALGFAYTVKILYDQNVMTTYVFTLL